MDETPRKVDRTRLTITIGIVLLAAGAVGGGVWYFMDQNEKAQTKSYNDSVAALQKQINELKAAAKNTSTKKTTPTTSATTSQATTSVQPGTVVTNFLTEYLNNLSKRSGVLTAAQFVAQRTDVTDNFKSSTSTPGLHADPIILAQNTPPNNNVTLGSVTTTSTSATVPVTLSFSGQSTLFYSLTLVNNAWEINDVTRG